MDSDIIESLKTPFFSSTNQLPLTSAPVILKQLESVITEFMADIEPDKEIGIALASFGQSHVIAVECVKAVGLNLIVFSGFENGNRVQLVQYVSQLNFLLLTLPAAVPGRRRTIGFQTE